LDGDIVDNLELGKHIKIRHLSSLGFGCIIGISWIILLESWLEQGVPLGAIITFGIPFVLVIYFIPVQHVSNRL